MADDLRNKDRILKAASDTKLMQRFFAEPTWVNFRFQGSMSEMIENFVREAKLSLPNQEIKENWYEESIDEEDYLPAN